MQYDIGMIGLGTMGRNLVLNIGDKGFSAAGYDKDFNKVSMLENETGQRKIYAAKSINEFVECLKKPRVVMMLVPAGAPVDAVISELLPKLGAGDIIIDGGNSHYIDTDRRIRGLEKNNISLLGVGISGGEKGARFGPSIMPGGNEKAYSHVKDIFEAVSAKVNSEPCVAYIGPGSAGHYVKMVHNGIEYGLIQLIAETYHLMKKGFDTSDDELHEIYSKWNHGELKSFLVEITAEIFLKKDESSDKKLINLISDTAKQKGTGKWTSQDAMDLQVPIPTIDAAVMMRDLSVYKEERQAASGRLHSPRSKPGMEKKDFIKKLGSALFFGMITTYAQGMALLKRASETYNYNIRLDEVAKIWRGGCIIRANLLENIYKTFSRKNEVPNLLVDKYFTDELTKRQSDTREIIKASVDLGIPVAAMMASLTYFDGYRSEWLPANLIQAQRDYFGSHTYERTDKEGIFHTDWSDNGISQKA